MTISSSIKKLRPLLLAVAGLLCIAAPARALGPDLFNVENLTAAIVDEAGNDYTLAGGHPFEASSSFSFPNNGTGPLEELKSVFTELPPGFVGNVAAAGRCPLADLAGFSGPSCPPGAQVGIITIDTLFPGGVTEFVLPLESVQPAPGYPAQFAFDFLGKVVMIYPQLRPRTGGYGINVVAPAAATIAAASIKVQLFGVPSAHNGSGGPTTPPISNPLHS